jgi:uncharacterized repeat protein (TIGR03803 family)
MSMSFHSGKFAKGARARSLASGFGTVLFGFLAQLLAVDGVSAAADTVLHVFTGGSDGENPEYGSLTMDKAGNLYGTTYSGGVDPCGQNVCGTVFEVTPNGAETVRHGFTGFAGEADGAGPEGGVSTDSAGNLFGTTSVGGADNDGAVFMLAPDASEAVLYSFCAQAHCSDGGEPQAAVIRDDAGNLYGTTYAGGNQGCLGGFGCGTVFRLAPNGTETVLHAFAGGSDGEYPVASLIRDRAGNLYGTTLDGGTGTCNNGTGEAPAGCGIVFEIARNGTETVLHTFVGGSDGSNPYAALIEDGAGNLYGTTLYGGSTGCNDYGCGTVFEIASNGTETVLYAFKGGSDGAYPTGALIEDSAGNLYGTTQSGGKHDDGTVFKLAPDGTRTILYSFKGGSDGAMPRAGLLKGKNNFLYGTTAVGGGASCGGAGCGTVFRVKE